MVAISSSADAFGKPRDAEPAAVARVLRAREDRGWETELAQDRQGVRDAAERIVERDVHELAVAGMLEQLAPGAPLVAARVQRSHLLFEVGHPDRERIVPVVGDRVIDEHEGTEEGHGGSSTILE